MWATLATTLAALVMAQPERVAPDFVPRVQIPRQQPRIPPEPSEPSAPGPQRDRVPNHVRAIELEVHETVLDGRQFGAAGAYEKLAGKIHFTWPPAASALDLVVDGRLADRSEGGSVRAVADFMILQPVDPEKSCGTALIEVSNRGGKAALGYFNRGRYAADPTTEAHFGDGWLMRQGVTVVWVGWQWDVPEEPGRLRLDVPVARESDDSPITGLVRADWVVDEATPVLALGHRNHVAYPVADPNHEDNVLTVRDGRYAPRRVVPRDAWDFAHVGEDGEILADRRHVWREGGFEAGHVYELVYRAEDPRVVGLGLAAIREMGLFLKDGFPDLRGMSLDRPAGMRAETETETETEGEARVPALHPVERTVAVGISQTGRFLRHFLYEGWNDVLQSGGRDDIYSHSRTGPAFRVIPFDGFLIHTAGAGRGSFNHRFAQPSRDAHRYSAFFYPTDLFPFTGRALRDPVSGRRAGLLEGHVLEAHASLQEGGPRILGSISRTHGAKVFFTNTGYEYWGRAASLIHTSLDGSADVAPLDDVRIYHLRSTQHFPVPFRPHEYGEDLDAAPSWRGNPVDFLVTERALLRALLDWVEDDVEPPPSAYPRVATGELVGLEGYAEAWHGAGGLPAPTVKHEAHAVDYGHGMNGGHDVITKQPPELGPAYETLVPMVDEAGNEVSGVPTVETLVPLGSYLPWHLRRDMAGGNGELTDFWGTFVPLPRTGEERMRWGDPRRSLESRYGDRERFQHIVQEVADVLVADRFLLAEDVPRVRARALAMWDWWVGERLPAADHP